VARYFDPLPFWYLPFEVAATDAQKFPLAAITQRPMFMYHAWGSQNAWLRQITARNWLYLHPDTARACGIADEAWLWLESPHGRIRVQAKCHDGTEPGTVWTWNAIGKKRGAWALAPKAPEFTEGFLLNHVISDVVAGKSGPAMANADPVTGQAAWFDLRVRIDAAAAGEPEQHAVDLAGARG
jgi:anaerobic selenocysteine-containing dehydrogenase